MSNYNRNNGKSKASNQRLSSDEAPQLLSTTSKSSLIKNASNIKNNQRLSNKQNKFKLIYRGFDRLEVAFKGAISHEVGEILDDMKKESQNKKINKYAFNLKGVDLKIENSGKRSGKKGDGYSYIVHTGEYGAIWFIKRSFDRRQWNFKVIVSSASLMRYGYDIVKKNIYHIGNDIFEAYLGEESIGRFDYCFDFLFPKFELKPENFIQSGGHSVSAKGDNVKERVRNAKLAKNKESKEPDFELNMIGRKFNSLRIGKMPGKQLAVYDKSREARQNKKYWFETWDVPSNSRVWRVELRAGKRYLKGRWNITSFTDLEERAGDILTHILKAIELRVPSKTDSLVSRWKTDSFWKELRNLVINIFGDTQFREPPGKVIRMKYKEMKDILEKQIRGDMIALSALGNVDFDDIATQIIPRIQTYLQSAINFDYKHLYNKYELAKKRYVFINQEKVAIEEQEFKEFIIKEEYQNMMNTYC